MLGRFWENGPVWLEEGGHFPFNGPKKPFGVAAGSKGLEKGPGGLLYVMGLEAQDSVDVRVQGVDVDGKDKRVIRDGRRGWRSRKERRSSTMSWRIGPEMDLVAGSQIDGAVKGHGLGVAVSG
ncbi:unnamed protein product [Arctogadus glacialis]